MASEVFLSLPKRTPIGSYLGTLKKLSASELMAEVMKAQLSEGRLDQSVIESVILGCVLTAGIGQAPARQAALKAGLSNTTRALTINKVCSSGLKAVILAAQEVALGVSSVVLAGGMESMSKAPFLLPSARSGLRLGNTELIDCIVHDGLWDSFTNQHMGNCGELCAERYQLTREEQDAFAKESYRRSLEAQQNSFFQSQIVSVDGINLDEEPGKLVLEKVSQLKPAFKKDGTITAANASSLNDGAAGILVTSKEAVEKFNLTPIAKITSYAEHSQAPEWFTTAPIEAIRNVLMKAQLSIDQIDLFEINEAFSSVVLACCRELNIDQVKVNITGGAVSLGHPIGASGARILVTMLHNLSRLNKRYGLCAICNGGGEATAMIVERVE
jgi:acetyl-CoA C-acetyltransferase